MTSKINFILSKKTKNQRFLARSSKTPNESKIPSSSKKFKILMAEVLEKVEPPKKELKIIKNSLKEFLKKFEKRLKALKINAEVFVGGSFAKDTMIKKLNCSLWVQ